MGHGKTKKAEERSVSSMWLKHPTQVWRSLLISEKDTPFEVCPFSRSSVRRRASVTADRIHQRKHLALHGSGMVSKDPEDRAIEQLMDTEPTSCTKHHSLVFKGWTAFRKAFTFRTANTMVAIWWFFPGRNRMNRSLIGIDQLPGVYSENVPNL